jgi:hypothetical protein
VQTFDLSIAYDVSKCTARARSLMLAIYARNPGASAAGPLSAAAVAPLWSSEIPSTRYP